MSKTKVSLENYEYMSNAWDEMFDLQGNIRYEYKSFKKVLKNININNLREMEDFAKQFFMTQGVTFTVYNNNEGIERIFPFDILPRIIKLKEWLEIEEGIKQRIKALNLFLKDIYHEQFILKDNVFPSNLISNNPQYLFEDRKSVV